MAVQVLAPVVAGAAKGWNFIKKLRDAKKLKNAAAAASKSKPLPKTNPVPKGQSPYKPTPQGGGGGARTNYNKPSSTSRPSTGTNPKTGTGQSGYNKPTAGSKTTTPPTTGAKIKGAFDAVTPTTTTVAKGLWKGTQKVLPKTGTVAKGLWKIADRSSVPLAALWGVNKLRGMFGGEDAPAGDKETGEGEGTRTYGQQGPTIDELLRDASPEKRAAYWNKKTGKTPATEENPADPAINDALRNQIFGPKTDDRKTSDFFTSGDKPKATTTGASSGSGSKTGLGYLRSRDEVKRMDREGKADIGERQRDRRLDAEARFRGRRDFIEEGRKIKDPNIIRKDGQKLGRVIKDSTGRIVGHSLNKAGRAAMGNRKGAGVIDGGVADASNFTGTDAQRTLAASAAMDKRDRQIAGMKANQDAVANLFYSQGGGGSGTGTDNTQVLRALPVEPTPKAIPVGEPEVSWGSRSQYNTSPSNKSPWAGISQGYVEGQGGWGLPAPSDKAPKAIPVNQTAPKAIPVAGQPPTDDELNQQFAAMKGNVLDTGGAQRGSNLLVEPNQQEEPSDALFPSGADLTGVKDKPVGNLVSSFLKKKKKNK